MIRPSATSEQVSFAASSSTYAIMKGEAITDDSGSRQPILLLPPTTTATMQPDDGGSTVQPVSPTITITEYSVDPNGYMALPTTLPLGTSYTYFCNIDVSDASQPSGSGTTFSQPALLYVDDFIGFETGTIVPAGYYDPWLGKWHAAANGQEITIVSVSAGQAVLDVDGSTLSPPVTSAELQTLATIYPHESGKKLWRIPIASSGIWSFSWPFELQLSAAQ